MEKELIEILENFGLQLLGIREFYLFEYNKNMYQLWVDEKNKMFSIGRFVCKSILETLNFQTSYEWLKVFYTDMFMNDSRGKHLSFLHLYTYKYDSKNIKQKEEFDNMIRDLDNGWEVLMSNVFFADSEFSNIQ